MFLWARSHRTFRGGLCATALVCLWAGPTPAQTTIRTAATGEYQYGSNVFDLQSGLAAPGPDPRARSDSFYDYGGELDLKYASSLQNWYATATGTEYYYRRFTQLDHGAYKFAGGWNWNLASVLDGTLDVTRTRAMVAFAELNQTARAIQTEQRETARIGYQIESDWRIEGKGYVRDVDEPLEMAPDLQLRENEGDATLRYIGTAEVTSGLTLAYLTGKFSGTNGTLNPDYHQATAAAVVTYTPTERSTFDGALGYTHRGSPSGINELSGITGHLDYKNQITGKTSVVLNLDRIINSYIANNGSEIDTNANLTVAWQMTFKTALMLAYTWTYRDLPGQGPLPDTNRIDHYQIASLRLDYEALPWIAIVPYANVQTRTSNVLGGAFNASVFGVLVTLQHQEP